MLFALALVVAACAPGFAAPSAPAVRPSDLARALPSTGSAAPPKRATSSESNDAGVRTACATELINDLVSAFNAGDATRLGRLVASGPLATQGFQWISIHDGLLSAESVAYTPDAAKRLLLDRWSRGQRLKLLSVNAGVGPSWHGGVDDGLRLESLTPTGTVMLEGKTALSCVSGVVFVLSLGTQ
jgi:hypothetical protein